MRKAQDLRRVSGSLIADGDHRHVVDD